MAFPKRSIEGTTTPKADKLWTQYRNVKPTFDDDSITSSGLEENEENLDPKAVGTTFVVPSPRKINMEKIEPCDRQYRSRSPLEGFADMKTPPRRILHRYIHSK